MNNFGAFLFGQTVTDNTPSELVALVRGNPRSYVRNTDLVAYSVA